MSWYKSVPIRERVVLDLCGGFGSWSDPYADAGYDVRIIDVRDGQDVRLFEPIDSVWGILAAPPCTDLAGSGARWWAEKGEQALLDALAIADACIRIITVHKPRWWALENPVGRLRTYYGEPRLIFDPCDYGDPYTKKTLVWGMFSIPETNPVEPTEGSKMHLMPPSDDRAMLRSITPPGFSKAFFEANP